MKKKTTYKTDGKDSLQVSHCKKEFSFFFFLQNPLLFFNAIERCCLSSANLFLFFPLAQICSLKCYMDKITAFWGSANVSL